ncbi:MAG TPA: DUF433 domain-containing protein [Blastocatellia bacterium]|nr:DUF433 domain-containing protein [Blastocatellia bacterium]
MAARKRKELGEHIVSDPEICGGDLTFRGTRVLVKDVLYYVSQGKDWDWIVAAYRGSITREAIGEAISLASEALTTNTVKRWRAA